MATREIVGYAMAAHHRASLVVDALRMAHGRGGLQPGCITHSDRGSDWLNPANTHQQSSAVKYVSWACDKAAAAPDHALTMPPRKASGPCSRKRSAPAPGPTGPPPAPRSSPSSRRSTTGAAYANTRSSATHPGRDQAAPPAHPCGIEIECPRSRGNFRCRTSVIVCIVRFSRWSPPRFSRCMLVRPDEAGSAQRRRRTPRRPRSGTGPEATN
ncbi:hypothetical protein [Streptomyces viridosporus]|uniref:hypothetical protein n=1 Tax=Streptomyces viridosporus TaxID=67581 RepID=UPI003CC67848